MRALNAESRALLSRNPFFFTSASVQAILIGMLVFFANTDSYLSLGRWMLTEWLDYVTD